LNFFNKSVELVKVDYNASKQLSYEGDKKNIYQNQHSISSVKIIENNSSKYDIKKIDGLTDIDYVFTISNRYVVTIDNNKLSEIYSLFEDVDKTIYIKIPIKEMTENDMSLITETIKDDFELDATNNITIEVNNLFDSATNYVYLIGNKTNVNQ
jgi:phosphotransferase system IIB component